MPAPLPARLAPLSSADPLQADVPGDLGCLDGEGRWTYDRHTMCRNIRVLYNFEPPTTEDEIRAAAVQYVRKVSGLAKPPAIDVVTFERAVGEVAATTRRLLGSLHARTSVRTREREREKARARGERRGARRSPA